MQALQTLAKHETIGAKWQNSHSGLYKAVNVHLACTHSHSTLKRAKRAQKKARIKPKNSNPRHYIKPLQILVKPHQTKPTSLSRSKSTPHQIKPEIKPKLNPIKLRAEVGRIHNSLSLLGLVRFGGVDI